MKMRTLTADEADLLAQQQGRFKEVKSEDGTISHIPRVSLELNATQLKVAYSTSQDGNWTYAVIMRAVPLNLATVQIGAAKRVTYPPKADVHRTDTGRRIAFCRALESDPISLNV